MASAGRFAIGSQFDLVNCFFSGVSGITPEQRGAPNDFIHFGDEDSVTRVVNASKNLAPGIYTKSDLATIFSLTNSSGQPFFGLDTQQYYYEDATDDYAARTLIFGSSSYKISDDTRFVVNSDGSRQIINYVVTPNTANADNFDFSSSNPLTAIANVALQPWLDPSGIGRTVQFSYDTSDIPEITYGLPEYLADISKSSTWNISTFGPIDVFKLYTDVHSLAKQSLGDGTIVYLNGNQPIVYGFLEGGPLDASPIAGSLGIGENDYLKPYLVNGVTFVGSAESDDITGTAYNDKIIGGPGDDEVDGAAGNDTVYYSGDAIDYNIVHDPDGFWVVDNVRGAKTDGKDVVDNVEQISFSDGQTYSLAQNGILDQTDLAFVIDTTGSMGPYIDAVKAEAASLIDAAFKTGTADTHVGIVGFKDPQAGYPDSVLLSFTNQTDLLDREQAAITAINGITIGGGGDTPEGDNSGLLLALDGSMGQWRDSAAVRRIVLFSDAPVKDAELAADVDALAANLGLSASPTGSIAGPDGAIGVNFALSPLAADTSATPFNVQIFTVALGTDPGAKTDLAAIASATGGGAYTAADGDALTKALLQIINLPAAGSEKLLFVATDSTSSETGRQIWTTDGTAGGTVLVKAINPTANSNAGVANVTVLGGITLFTASDGAHGSELWATDGTTAGTIRLDPAPDTSAPSYVNPNSFTPLGSKLLFMATDNTSAKTGTQLWVTDGTTAGTGLLLAINPSAGSNAQASDFTVAGTLIYFTANDGSHGTELWVTDGTTAGTVRLDPAPDTSPASYTNPGQLTPFGSNFLFVATDNTSAKTGRQLWITDGTTAGTSLLKAIDPSAGSDAQIASFTIIGSTAFFTATDGTHGIELWATDGTAAGTVRLDPGAASNADFYTAPTSFTPLGSKLLFVATDNTFAITGTQLWVTDGTPAGTMLLKAINPSARSNALASNFVVVGTKAFFTASDGSHGSELWSTDGTTPGTVRLDPTPATSIASYKNPTELTPLGTKVLFIATDNTSASTGTQVWVTDGTALGTSLLKAIDPTANSNAGAANFTIVGNEAIFTATDGVHGTELWATDGTTANTIRLDPAPVTSAATYSNPNTLTLLGNKLLFIATDNTSAQTGTQLWVTDGTAAGTMLLMAINPTPNSNAQVANFTVVSNEAFFTANDGTHGTELWVTDGTTAGTIRLDQPPVQSLTSFINLNSFTSIGNKLLFVATDNSATNSGRRLWVSDGTPAGTSLLTTITPSPLAVGQTSDFAVIGNDAFFTADDGAHGQEVWVTDGTEAGTVRLDPAPATSIASYVNPGELTTIGGKLLFIATDNTAAQTGTQVWVTDGTAAGTSLLKAINPTAGSDAQATNFTIVGNLAYFTATDGAHGIEVWVTDGTTAGTIRMDPAPVTSAASYVAPNSFTPLGDKLLFVATDNTSANTGTQLWVTDGTPAGTALLKAIDPTANSNAVASNFTIVGSRVVFTANDGAHGVELWVTDDTTAGTLRLDPAPDTSAPSYTNPTELTPLKGTTSNKLLFIATDNTSANTGTQVWVTDGTPAGTALLKAIDPTIGSNAQAANFMMVGNQAFFTANDGAHGVELWVTDGTSAGTLRMDPAPATSAPSYVNASRFTPLGTKLLFVATDNTSANTGTQLWVSDGTLAGTMLLKSINPSAGSDSGAANFTLVGNRVLFTATDGAHGTELWATDGTSAGTVRLDQAPDSSAASYIDPTGFTPFGNKLLFIATDNTAAQTGTQVWITDGTPADTQLLKAINPSATANSEAANFTIIGNVAYFTATDGVHGNELWVTDGTTNGTVQLDQAPPTSTTSYVSPSIPVVPSYSISAVDATKSNLSSSEVAFRFQVTRTGDTSGAASLQFRVSGSGAAPAVAANFAGGVFPAGTVDFAPDDLVQTITVNVLGAAATHPNQTFQITLSPPPGISASGSGLNIATASAAGVIESTTVEPFTAIVANESEFNAALIQFDVGGSQAAVNTSYTIDIAQSFTLDAALQTIDLPAGSSLVINGAGETIDGGGSFGGLTLLAGSLTHNDLTFTDTAATGGAGGSDVGNLGTNAQVFFSGSAQQEFAELGGGVVSPSATVDVVTLLRGTATFDDSYGQTTINLDTVAGSTTVPGGSPLSHPFGQALIIENFGNGQTTVNVHSNTIGGVVDGDVMSFRGTSTVATTVTAAGGYDSLGAATGGVGLWALLKSGNAFINGNGSNVIVFPTGPGVAATLFGGAGSDIDVGAGGLIHGGSAGSNILWGSAVAGSTTLVGGGVGDVLVQQGANNLMQAGPGSEQLWALAPGNTFQGFTGTQVSGANTFMGGITGGDTYITGNGAPGTVGGDGTTINSTNDSNGGNLFLEGVANLGSGTDANTATVSGFVSGSDTVLLVNPAGGTYSLVGNSAAVPTPGQVDFQYVGANTQLSFGDGTTWTIINAQLQTTDFH